VILQVAASDGTLEERRTLAVGLVKQLGHIEGSADGPGA
jgi:hypothetical protein